MKSGKYDMLRALSEFSEKHFLKVYFCTMWQSWKITLQCWWVLKLKYNFIFNSNLRSLICFFIYSLSAFHSAQKSIANDGWLHLGQIWIYNFILCIDTECLKNKYSSTSSHHNLKIDIISSSSSYCVLLFPASEYVTWKWNSER